MGINCHGVTYKDYLQGLPTRINYEHYLQGLPTIVSCDAVKDYLQGLTTRITYKDYLQGLPTRITYKDYLQLFPTNCYLQFLRILNSLPLWQTSTILRKFPIIPQKFPIIYTMEVSDNTTEDTGTYDNTTEA